MTTHVFIVDDNTFKYHLQYMFAGTGAGNKTVDFNNEDGESNLHFQTENLLVSMIADGSRIRKNDLIIFYLQATTSSEGRFYGIFQAVEDGIFLDNLNDNQFLYKELKKSLLFRLHIKPYEIYEKGVTEWQALDEIKKINSPFQMLWSLIYRKLKGNRGNTMITIYESERLINLIREENENKELNLNKEEGLSFDSKQRVIIKHKNKHTYLGAREEINILPRLCKKYLSSLSHEAHLQSYISQNIGKGINKSLDDIFEINRINLEWLGNEVSCGVGMQRIDIMFSKYIKETQRVIYPIELKAVPASDNNTRQLNRYINWLEQYYIPNRISSIQPVLICKKTEKLSSSIIESFKEFNKRKGILPLIYIEYEITEGKIVFNKKEY